MQFKKKVLYSGVVSFIVLVLSISLRITPCRIAPAVPNPVYKWTFCTLNPDQVGSFNSIKEFFGYTSSLSEAYFITILLTFAITFFILHFFTNKK
ncbi:MAG: hypothetical protein WC494_02680 [Candidatus Pacearchaeota archaeon]